MIMMKDSPKKDLMKHQLKKVFPNKNRTQWKKKSFLRQSRILRKSQFQLLKISSLFNRSLKFRNRIQLQSNKKVRLSNQKRREWFPRRILRWKMKRILSSSKVILSLYMIRKKTNQFPSSLNNQITILLRKKKKKFQKIQISNSQMMSQLKIFRKNLMRICSKRIKTMSLNFDSIHSLIINN